MILELKDGNDQLSDLYSKSVVGGFTCEPPGLCIIVHIVWNLLILE